MKKHSFFGMIEILQKRTKAQISTLKADMQNTVMEETKEQNQEQKEESKEEFKDEKMKSEEEPKIEIQEGE